MALGRLLRYLHHFILISTRNRHAVCGTEPMSCVLCSALALPSLTRSSAACGEPRVFHLHRIPRCMRHHQCRVG
jgi:hypothetical protein